MQITLPACVFSRFKVPSVRGQRRVAQLVDGRVTGGHRHGLASRIWGARSRSSKDNRLALVFSRQLALNAGERHSNNFLMRPMDAIPGICLFGWCHGQILSSSYDITGFGATYRREISRSTNVGSLGCAGTLLAVSANSRGDDSRIAQQGEPHPHVPSFDVAVIPSRCAPDACHPVFFRIQVHDTVPWFPVLEISDLNIFWYFGQR
jgi:hypothetical protein